VKHVYIASPYTIGDKKKNVIRSIRAAEGLVSAGFIPFVPLLSHYWDDLHPHNYEFWLDMSVSHMKRQDAVLRLAGESRGADREEEVARGMGIPVYYNISDLVEHEGKQCGCG
jgi:hypothetical protein